MIYYIMMIGQLQLFILLEIESLGSLLTGRIADWESGFIDIANRSCNFRGHWEQRGFLFRLDHQSDLFDGFLLRSAAPAGKYKEVHRMMFWGKSLISVLRKMVSHRGATVIVHIYCIIKACSDAEACWPDWEIMRVANLNHSSDYLGKINPV